MALPVDTELGASLTDMGAEAMEDRARTKQDDSKGSDEEGVDDDDDEDVQSNGSWESDTTTAL
eukprot:192237-Rhodomonas_salina.1